MNPGRSSANELSSSENAVQRQHRSHRLQRQLELSSSENAVQRQRVSHRATDADELSSSENAVQRQLALVEITPEM
jgi:hypothetical protein